MHLIHKLRRSISHRPRHFFDLPDEILCLILEYCCQDLDFLLWSCPLVTLENQFCHDCFHCTLCHGPVPRPTTLYRSLTHRQRNHRRSSMSSASRVDGVGTTGAQNGGIDLTHSSSRTSSGGAIQETHTDLPHNRAGLRKRRKRSHEGSACSTIANQGGDRNSNNSSRGRCATNGRQRDARGAKPCPRNGNRPWCHHLQLQSPARIPLLWRLLPQSITQSGHSWDLHLPSFFNIGRMRTLSRPYDHINSISSSLASVRPPAKVALNRLVHRVEGLISFLSYPEQRQGVDDSVRLASLEATSDTLSDSLVSATTGLAPAEPEVPVAPIGHSTGLSSTQGSSLNRRRTLSMSAHAAEPSSTTMNQSWSIAETIQIPTLWRRDDRTESPDLPSDDLESGSEDDECRDDFDRTIHLAAPFQLLLVSRRFADAAVQSLWRSLVFHGQDSYQMQSILSALSMEDGLSDDRLLTDHGHCPSGLEKVKELDEEEDSEDEVTGEQSDKAQDRSRRRHATEMKTGPAASDGNVYPPKHGSGEYRPPCEAREDGARLSWIESLNKSLKQFSRFQGVPGSYRSNTESKEGGGYGVRGKALGFAGTQTAATNTQRRHTSAGSSVKHPSSSQGASSPVDRLHIDRHQSSRTNSNEPRWPYRRHVRRVVLNFAHPQTSPQMFVNVLECLRSRCSDQIVALDLHANEKMRDAGLEKTEEVERLFGLGFSKLRYLRLQGGFVDNQLLCAMIKGLNAPVTPALDRPGLENERHSHGSSGIPPGYNSPPCRLSQVFLGPGSVTDSAVEKLIAAAGHSLEVFTVASCVDVGGGALASLLTKCPKLRVLGVHRSLARDRDLLEGLGIELEVDVNGQVPGYAGAIGIGTDPKTQTAPPTIVRKTIVAPLERLELGTVKLTRVGVTEILKGTCSTLRFLVLETQHFSEELLTDVIAPFCTQLEGIYFDDPEHVQKQQQQLQGIGFSAGRRGPNMPNWQFEFGRSRRTFYSDPNRQHQQSQQQQQQQQQPDPSQFMSADFAERQNSIRSRSGSNVSARLGETSVEDWIAYGDCALWTSAASPSVSFENGGANSGGQGPANHHPRRQPLPLHHAYHSPAFLTTLNQSRAGASSGIYPTNINSNVFIGEYDDVLQRFQVTRPTVENVLQTLQRLGAFTVMHLDFIQESQGLSEWKTLMRQDEIWVQSAGFRALQVFYLGLFLCTIYFGTLRW